MSCVPFPHVECLAGSVQGSWRKHWVVHEAKEVVEEEGEEAVEERGEEEAGVAVKLFSRIKY